MEVWYGRETGEKYEKITDKIQFPVFVMVFIRHGSSLNYFDPIAEVFDFFSIIHISKEQILSIANFPRLKISGEI